MHVAPGPRPDSPGSSLLADNVPARTGTNEGLETVFLVMYGRANHSMMRSFRHDPSVTHQKLKPGTVRRIMGYAKPYKLYLSLFLAATVLDALITVVNPAMRAVFRTFPMSLSDWVLLGLLTTSIIPAVELLKAAERLFSGISARKRHN